MKFKMRIENERQVLDHGIVRLVDHMGNDSRIVEAARTSISGEGVKAVTDDRNLIRYLLRHKHTTPFEQVKFQFFVKMPILVARQFIRHRTLSVNEMSARYSILPREFYVPETPKFQSTNNKQGAGEAIPEPLAQKVKDSIVDNSIGAYALYEELLGTQDREICMNFMPDEVDALEASGGLARELARMVLPVNFYTQWYHTQDLWNLMHFLRLRLDPHAQEEIRVYAQAMYELVQPVCPIALEAFDDYTLNAVTFSRMEMDVLREWLAYLPDNQGMLAQSEHLQKQLGSKREVTEFLSKVKV